jgi:transcriptional regulator with XRE-family HTH domain
LKQTIGQSLQKALRKRKMSQRQLSILIDKPATQLNKWMLDKNEIGVYTLIDIADALNMSLDELLDRNVMQEDSDHYIINDNSGDVYTKLPSKEFNSMREDILALQSQLTKINEALSKLNIPKDDKKSQ